MAEINIKDENENNNYEILMTRASYDKANSSTSSQSSFASVGGKRKIIHRGKNFFLCQEHYNEVGKWSWIPSVSGNCPSCIMYKSRDSFENGTLPIGKEVMEFVITARNNNNGRHGNNIHTCSKDLVLQWIFCNVYTHTVAAVAKRIQNMDDAFKALKKSSSRSRLSDKHWKDYTSFVEHQRKLFDIKSLPERKTVQEQIWGVKMTEKEEQFYENQCLTPQVGSCSSFVERKWKLSQLRKEKSAQSAEDMKKKAQEYEKSFNSSCCSGGVDRDEEEKEGEEEDVFDKDSAYEFDKSTGKKSKYAFNSTLLDDKDDQMPFEFRHIRNGARSVRPEYYILVHKLKAELHMSERQAQGAIIEVANELFGCKKFGEWTLYEQNKVADVNTLPAPSNINRTEPYVEAMVLAGIVSEMMSAESDETVITYANDGSSKSSVGSFIVQSFIINGKQRALPVMPIFTESKQSLKELEIATLNILSAASGRKYSESEILERISYVMTDSTAHNLGVMDNVCDELGVESKPSGLICHIHPLLMFQRKIIETFKEIHEALGVKAIKDCFLVDIEFRNQTIVEKALHCLSSFISKEFSSKPWNRNEHFDTFISPKKNETLSLKDHRFNRLMDCALTVLYHLDDIKLYLDRFSNIMNDIAILDRSFLEMDIFKPIFCVTSLIGIHITRPFQALLLDTETTYDTLLKSFSLLYQKLTDIPVEDFLQTSNHVCTFVTNKKFKDSLPKPCLVATVNEHLAIYRKEVSHLMSIMLPKLAKGFSDQRGAIFGFGPLHDCDTGAVLKVSDLDEAKRQKLNSAPIHNLNEERSVGWFNYEIDFRGHQHMESVSRKMVVNKNVDILMSQNPKEMYKFAKPAAKIKEIKMEWKEKVKEQQKLGLSDKETANLKVESVRYSLLELLKNDSVPGPFTKASEVHEYFKLAIDDKIKNKRMYNEVKYARLSSMSLKPTAAVFRLKRNSRDLETREYVDNLASYLDSARVCKTLTLCDLSNALHGISAKAGIVPSVRLNDSYTMGEHVAAFWYEGERFAWYLGVVDGFDVENDNIIISYLNRRDADGHEWEFPEDADIHPTSQEQILFSSISVNYMRSVKIQCRIISNELVSEINSKVRKLSK